MYQIEGYRTSATLYVSDTTLVLRAQRNSDNRPVVLKLLRSSHPTDLELARYRREFALLRSIDNPWVISALALETWGHSLFLVLEDFGAESLATLLARQSFTLEERLRMALAVADGLHLLHQQHILHRDVNPANIVYNPATGQCKLIDFGLASRLSPSHPGLHPGHTLEGTLAYLSPEQTGRMNRQVDYRSDLYALGVSLYELLAGRLPFAAQHPLEMVHAHIATVAPPLQTLRADIPPILGAIVERLMAKQAEQRYQSAAGLRADLAACLQACDSQGQIAAFTFTLGQHDHSSTFFLPQRLYGRETETAALLTAFEQRVCAQGETVLMLVSGYAGSGKTLLAKELHRPMVRSNGYFIEGKFDQYQRNIPYYAFKQALAQLVDSWLGAGPQRLAAVAVALREALGDIAAVMLELVPSLEAIIGPQPAAPPLSGVEAHNRFQHVCRSFFRCAASAEQPLVVFIDDLQWADLASLQLLSALVTDKRIGHVLLIGAYRDNETAPTHPLMLLLRQLREAQVPIEAIRVDTLSRSDVAALCADTLHQGLDAVAQLAGLIHTKTQGNPFFVTRFLQTLHAEGLIVFDPAAPAWVWDDGRIRQHAIPDNAVQLMAARMATLAAPTQRLLTLAACVGNAFALDTLAVIGAQEPQSIRQHLEAPVREGLLLQMDSQAHYRFSHDRIQQAAYSLADNSAQLHLRIGRLLLGAGEPAGEALFQVVNQFNAALELLDDPQERLALARLNHRAGQQAQAGAAYASALRYLGSAAELLPGTAWEAWEQHRELAFDIHCALAWCRFYAGETEGLEALFAKLLAHARQWDEAVRVHAIRMEHYHLAGDYKRAIAIQKEALQLLGVAMGEDQNAIRSLLQQELEAVPRLLGTRAIEALPQAPAMQSAQQAAIMDILMRLWTSAYLDAQMELVAWSSCKMTNISLEHGNNRLTSYGYMNYAFVCVAMLGQYETGHRFGQVAIQLAEQYDDLLLRGKVYLLFAVFVNHWRAPLATSLDYSLKSFPLLVDNGDWTYAAYCAEFIISDPTIWGMGCDAILDAAQGYLPFLENNAPVVLDEFVRPACLNPVLQLLGRTRGDHTFDDDQFQEAVFLDKYRNNPLALAYFYTAKLRSLYWFGHWEQALAMVDQADFVAAVALAQAKVPEVYFFACLSILAQYERLDEPTQTRLAARVASYQEHMRIWAENSPANFRHKYLLVEAERARIANREWEAVRLFEAAAAQAHKAGYLHNEALAYECAGRFFLGRDLPRIAAHFLREARYTYHRWGASAKVSQLEQRYPALLSSTALDGERQTHPLPVQVSYAAHTSDTSDSHPLDFLSIVQASQSLADEINLDRLLDKMLHIAMQNAGANRTVLLLHDQGHWRIRAELRTPADALAADVPQHLIHYCAHKQTSVVLGNAAARGNFMGDPYFAATGMKSALCMPLQYANSLKGLLYFENSLLEDAFTPGRLQVLELLSSQMAISLDNADLYQELEQRIAQRTGELAQANAQLQAANRVLETLTNTDGLTHIANRRMLDRVLEAEWKRHGRARQEMALILCDIDHFKTFNDTYGHLEGDRCLQHVASAIQAAAKRPGDLVARYGGEEFAVVLPQTDLPGLQQVLADIHASVAALAIPHAASTAGACVTLSMGAVHTVPDEGNDANDANVQHLDALARADAALYQAKSQGRNRAVIGEVCAQ